MNKAKSIAEERYKDLQDYFNDTQIAKAILENGKEFRAWLKRMKWHVKKADELARKIKTIEKIIEKYER